MDRARPVLGTVQLGLPYGVANSTGKPDFHAALAIVRAAWDGGVREFDTAADYGDSEAVLGRALAELGVAGRAEVSSKTPADWDGADFAVLDRSLDASLKRLGLDRLEHLLLHREHLLDRWDQGPGRCLERVVADGRVRHAGVSVYTPEAARRALELDGLDSLQIPSNLLDRRFERAGVERLARDRGKRLFVRSVFLQGLLLLEPSALPPGLAFAGEAVAAAAALADEFGLTRLEAALGFARQAWPGSGVLFGAETPEQVRENLAAFAREVPAELAARARERFPDLPQKLLNPSLWEA